MAKKSPRERRHDRTRQAILKAASDLIAEHGAEGLSLREIARTIDYSPAGLYEYFGSKAEILEAVCIESNLRLTAHLRAVPMDLPLEEYLIEFGLAYIRFARQDTAFFLMMFNYSKAQGTTPPTRSQLDPQDAYGVLLQAVQRAVDEGFVHTATDAESATLAYYLWGMVHGLALLQITYLSNMQWDFEADDRKALRTLVRGMRLSS